MSTKSLIEAVHQADIAVAGIDTQTELIQIIERAARDPSIDVDKLERLLAMKERLDAKASETEFNAAMTLAQSEIVRVHADKQNSQTSSWYATYAALDRALRPIYTRHGFALSFGTGDAPPDYVLITCNVSHRLGHSRHYQILMPADGKGAKGGDLMTKTHATGSATQYGMRYLLKMIFNVAIGEDSADDDGNAAAGRRLEYITLEQGFELDAIINDNGLDRAAFMNLLAKKGLRSFDEIKAADFEKLKRLLLNKVRS